jgi:hypothetical protein
LDRAGRSSKVSDELAEAGRKRADDYNCSDRPGAREADKDASGAIIGAYFVAYKEATPLAKSTHE